MHLCKQNKKCFWSFHSCLYLLYYYTNGMDKGNLIQMAFLQDSTDLSLRFIVHTYLKKRHGIEIWIMGRVDNCGIGKVGIKKINGIYNYFTYTEL